MRTWVFQGNPDQFDIDGYLASRPALFSWLVTRYADEIREGDHVFIWRTGGEQRAVTGIIAEAEVVSAPEPRPEDPDALPYWRSEAAARTDIRPRSLLRLLSTATRREVLRRDWLLEDPILRDLPNLKMAAGTNYPVEPHQAERLAALWARTGRDWTRNEGVAGLWAYAQTYGEAVSRLPGSPVAVVATTIGRAVSGVYNKAMNFRSIDPRDARAGMSGSGEVDRAVWNEFFDNDTGALRLADLEREFNRLWNSSAIAAVPALEAGEHEHRLDAEASRLASEGLAALMEKYRVEHETRPARPNASSVLTRAYERSPLVVAIAKLRAGNRCQVPDCKHPIFLCADGLPYVEVHHMKPLSDGGEDTLENVCCLCPAHHREVHLGRQATEVLNSLRPVPLLAGDR
jgi:hypothetical protein